MKFLEVNNLDIEYQTRKETIYASKNVSFNLQRGEIIGIVGESGSGKSTVANAIINLIDKPGIITNGSIRLDGRELHNDTDVIKSIRGKKIGFIFQDPQTSLNPLFKIRDQLIETIQTHSDLNYKEAESNVAIRVTEALSGDAFEVAGRGELQMGVLIENMRR